MANQDATDLGILWTRAVDKYTQKTGQKLAHLRGQSISDVMQTTAVEKKRFESYRHDNGKLDKVRAAFGRHLDGMQKCLDGVQTIGEAASAFPPAMPVGIIFAACGHMFQAFAGVQKDYDQAEAFFDHSRRFFDNLTLLEGKTDPRPLAKAIVRTFASQLVICGIVQDMKNNGRFKQWLNALWNLESPELAAAYAEMQASIEELGATVGYATYSAIRDAYEELKATHEDVGEISEKIDELDANISRVRESMGEQLQTLYASNLGLDKKITEGFDGVQAKQDEAYAIQLRIAQMQENLLNAFEKASMPASSDTKSHSGDIPSDSANEKAQALDTVKTFFIGNSILFPRIEKVLDANRIERERIKRERVDDSVAWLAEHPNFTRWLDGQVTCLKICGSTGMGKSFSMEAAIDLVQRSTNPPSDVAYYFVQPDLDLPQSTEAAFACAALQVVEANHRYAEQVASDIKEDVQKLVNRVNRLVYWKTSGVIEADTSTDLVDVPIWKRFFTSGYTGVASSKRRLFLILDGMDELPNGLDQLVAFLLDLQQSEAPIHVLLSTRDAAWPSDSRIQTVTIDLTRDLITPGLKSVVKHRLRSSQRLRSFSTQLKRKMYRKIVSQADSMLYVEHILRRLSHISRESIVNKELENLPRGLPEVYSSLMEECGRYRSKKQLEGLRTLFAWLAFCKRPLTLGEVITLFRASEPNEGLKLDIEEEITVKCSSILELSQSHVRGIDTKATSQEDVTEFDDDQSSDDDEMDVELFNAANVAFADQPLRRYFRSATLASATDLKDLRIAAPQAHLRLFSACIDIITKTTNQAEPQQHIQEYAVVYWKEHFCELNPEESSETMACQVVCALYLLMANVDPYAQVLSRKHISPSEFYPDRTSSTIPWYERILAWTQQGLELPAGLLPPHVMEWAMSIDRESILLTFGRGHYNVWMHNANDTSPRGYELAQRCAQLAGVLDCAIEDDPMKDGLSLVHYFSPGNMNTDVLRALGLLAWAQFWKFDFKGNRTAKNNVIKESSSYLRRSLESMHSSGMERVRLIRLLYFNRNTVGAFESTQMLKWADEGLAILDRLDPLASTVQEKQEIQEKRRELLTRKIMSGLMPLNQWEELHEACKLYRAKYGLAASLPQQDMMEAFITACDKLDPTGRQRKQLMQSLSKKERQVWLGWLFNRITTSVQRNATRISDWAGSEDVHLWITWLTEFEKSRPWRPFYGLKKRNVLWPDPYQRLVALGCLAHLYFENLHDAEQAKKIHRKILALGEPKVQDRKFGMKREVERIRNRHVGLIFAQFQDATSWSRKEALLGEAMTMPNFSDENLHGCHAGALVARMLKVVEPKKYQPFMENTFKVLVNDLKDGIASNDGTSLTALAMLLASLPSLERDALIALSLRHSVLDRELHGRVYDDENSDTHGDLSGYIAYCDRCKKSGSDWTTPLWKCLECANVDLCDACLQSHRACLREAHNDESFIHKELKDWAKLCIETHRFIRGPIKGWRGVRKGVIRVGENCFEVKDWLKSLREERWPKAWAWYWKTCGLNHDVGGEDD